MGKPFSSERLATIRRMRKARRIFKRQPLFAFEILRQEYPDYTYEKFLDDLRYRKPPKKRKGKSGLLRYGRFDRMEKMKALFAETGKLEYGLQAQRLRRFMTKPYRVQFRIDGEVLEYHFSALIPIERIEKLTMELRGCDSIAKAEKVIEYFNASSHIN